MIEQNESDKLNKRGNKCFVCGYEEEHGNIPLPCGHWLCDDCALSGEALDHTCDDQQSEENG